MGNLEKIVSNFEKGIYTGVIKVFDPVGNVLSGVDYSLTGVGFSDPRALKTVHNEIYKAAYDKPEEKVSFGKGYIPRFLGNAVGAGAAGLGLYGLYQSFGWLAAATIPLITGVYSGYQTVKKYISDFKNGEKIGDSYQKAKFYDGFKFGWESGTHLFIDDLHGLETNYTGRSIYQSRLDSSMRDSSKYARRNFSSVAGTVVGGLTGGIVSLLTLGILPLYKSIRDTAKTVKNKES